MGAAAGTIAIGTVAAGAIGAGAAVYSANTAAGEQSDAAKAAIDNSRQQQAITRADLMPYNTAGQSVLPDLTAAAKAPGPVMDQATLEATPGYQFNLTQGLKATQNAAAARGLGVSGAALKGAATYATGLADSTYQNQFNNAVTNQTNAYNRLAGVANLGESAAAQTGTLGTQIATGIGNNLVGAGNANAASSIATGNAIGSAAQSVPNGLLLQSLVNNQAKTGIYGGTSGTYSGNFNSSGP